MYLNGAQIAQATDNAITSGSPGIGFDAADNGVNSRQSVYDQFGFDSYSATDGLTTLSYESMTPARTAQSWRVTSSSGRLIAIGTSDPGVLRGEVYTCNGAFVASFQATMGTGASIAVEHPGLFLVRCNGRNGGIVSRVLVK
jgi:hypothetical protein